MVRGSLGSSSSGGRRHDTRRGSISSPAPLTPAFGLRAPEPLTQVSGPSTFAPLSLAFGPSVSAPPALASGSSAFASLSPACGPSIPVSQTPVFSPTVSAPLVSASGPSASVPLPPASSPSVSTPPAPAFGPSVSAPLTSAFGSSASTPPAADDDASHPEGEDNHVEDTRLVVWINGNKLEPVQASQFITKTIQSHFPGPIYKFSDFPMDVQNILYDMFMRSHRFTRPEDIAQSRSAWTATARANFKHMMFNVRKKAQKNYGSTEMTCWKEHGPAWMRSEHWEGLCNKWADEKWGENSAKAKFSRAAQPETKELKRPSTFQEVFDQTHKKKVTNDYINGRAQEVAESCSKSMNEKYGEEGTQQPDLDPDVWIAATGAPKKGHVYGFRHSLDASKLISVCSSSSSVATCAFTTSPSSSSDDIKSIIRDEISTLYAQFRQTLKAQVMDAVQVILSQTHIPHHTTPSTVVQPPHDDQLESTKAEMGRSGGVDKSRNGRGEARE